MVATIRKEVKTMVKKLISISAVCLLVVMCFASCAALDFAKQIIESVTYPDEYLIEYQITNEDGTVTRISKGVDENGSCYYKDSSAEYLFIKNEKVYDEYQCVDGIWTITGNSYTEAKVKELTSGFNTYAEKSREQFNGKYEKGEEKTHVGKPCTEYTLTLKIGNFEQNYIMLVENETGICLKYYGTSTVSSIETQKTGFECTKFETQNINFASLIA